MSGVFKPRMEILPLAQQRLWLELKPVVKLGFVLFGTRTRQGFVLWDDWI